MADSKQARKKLPTLRSPQGVAAFAWIAKPDSGKKYSDDKHKVTLVLPKGDTESPWRDAEGNNRKGVEEFVKYIDEMHTDARGKKKTESPVKDGDGKDKEEFKGKWLLTFKSKYQPQCVDSKKTELTGEALPKSGDVIKVGFATMPYEEGKNAGISLQLRAVQLIEKRARANYGDAFDEEDGYEAPEKQAESGKDEGEDKKSSGGNDNPDF